MDKDSNGVLFDSNSNFGYIFNIDPFAALLGIPLFEGYSLGVNSRFGFSSAAERVAAAESVETRSLCPTAPATLIAFQMVQPPL
jgi:hypothetical protein